LVVATALTVYGIETFAFRAWGRDIENRGCNSPYRLRY